MNLNSDSFLVENPSYLLATDVLVEALSAGEIIPVIRVLEPEPQPKINILIDPDPNDRGGGYATI